MAKGRPREFDAEEALNRALIVFWRKGYEGASLPDLTEAMGISRPSLYAAFGNKEALFRKALDRYAEGPASYIRKSLGLAKAKSVFEGLLRGAADSLTHSRHPRGCLMVQGALTCADACESVRHELTARRAHAEAAIRKRFEKARAEGDLPQRADPADLARYVTTMIQGMSVQAAGGASRNELRRVAEAAIRAWPE